METADQILVEGILGKMGWLEQHVFALLDREDSNNLDKHNLAAQFWDNLAVQFQDDLTKDYTVEFAFANLGKEFEEYIDMVSLWDFASSLCKMGQVVSMPCHISVNPFGFEELLGCVIFFP